MTDTTSSMSPARWARLQEIFDEALTIDAADRAAYIARACADDLSLREQVLALVFASGAADARFEEHIDRAVSATARDSLEFAAGDSIGCYRVLSVMGRGGMGTVYRAERADEQYRQFVAVKVMSRLSATGTTAARFRAERQILANLTHANISRLLDGGTTAKGVPFLVMEYIEGEPIDAYCDRLKLPVRSRLGLFQVACGAVHYAHQSLIVHRDLKPSNILVTRDGTVKLLDFGIAKLLRPESAPHTVAMTQAVRLMTPEHASPEQIRGESITTATDVYSLGVLLYQLLCGRSPYHARSPTAGRLEEAILEQAPVPPSEAILANAGDSQDGADSAASIAARRSTTPERLRQEIRGDLDTIVLVALRKEADRRYSSAQALADDIGRHLRHLPVTAQRDTFTYRARKFTGRHRLSIVSGAAMVLAVVTLTIVYTVRLAAERDRAEEEATKARVVAEVLTNVFRQAEPAQARGEELTALELLDRGAGDIEKNLAGQPLVQADLMHALGFSYMTLGAWDKAVVLLERALAMRSAAGREDTREYAKALYDLAGLKRFQMKHREAEALYLRALSVQQKLFDGPHGDTAQTLSHLAVLYHELQRYPQSLEVQMQALAMTRTAFGERHIETANRLSNLALPLQELNRYEEAEQALRDAVEIQVAELGPNHPNSLVYRYNLAALLRNTGRYDESEQRMREVLTTRRVVLGATHPRVLSNESALASVLTTLARFDEAEQLLQQTIQVQKAKLGPRHSGTASTLRNLGALELARGRYAQAEQHLRGVLEIERTIYGESSDAVHRTNALLGAALAGRGRNQEAGQLLERSYAALHASSGDESPGITSTLEALAAVRVSQGRLDEAVALYEQALRNHEAAGGPAHPLIADPLAALADIALRRGQPAQAAEMCRRALAVLEPRFPADYWRTAVVSVVLGRALLATGRGADAASLIRASHETLRQTFGDADPRTRAARDALLQTRLSS